MKIMTIKMKPEDVAEFKKLCKAEDTTMSQDIRKYIKGRIMKAKEK